MADDKEYSEEEEEEEEEEVITTTKVSGGVSEEPKEEPKAPEISEAELAMEKMRKKKEEEEAMWTEYMEQRKKQRAKEEEDLKKLKERQMKRKEKRKEEEKKLLALKKQQEAQRVKEMEEKKAREAEAKKKRLEEAEKKRQAMQEALQRNKVQEPVIPNFVITKRGEDGGTIHPALEKLPSALYMRGELAKTKEQLAEDKKIALQVRVKPLNLENLSIVDLRQKAQSLWEAIVRLESEKYDLEERKKRQEYDLKELSERQRQINRSKALKKGLDPDALSGKYPPMINVASKYERRLDRRSFVDKKSLFEGGYMSQLEQQVASEWENKVKNFKEQHGPQKLPKWDPSAAKNKEKPERPETIEDEDIEDVLLGPSSADMLVDGDEAPSEPAKEEEEEEEEEEAEEEEEE